MKIKKNHLNERIENDKKIQIKKKNLTILIWMRRNSIDSSQVSR
jgi:hypothetical protein